MTSTELDALLANWASRQRLTPAESENIRQAVLAEPEITPLPATWWRDFTLRMSEQIVRTTRPRAREWLPTSGRR